MPHEGPEGRDSAADADFAAQVAGLAEAAPGLLTRALRGGGDYADLFYEHTLHHRLLLRQQSAAVGVRPPLRRAEQGLQAGAGLRVLDGDRVGYAATAERSPGALTALADEAAPGGGGALRREAARPAAPVLALDLPPDAPDAVTEAEKTALLEAAADAAFSLDARVRAVEVQYQDRVRRFAVATSEGVLVGGAAMLLGLRVDVTLAGRGRTVTTHAVTGAPAGLGHFLSYRPEQVAQAAVERARALVEARPVRPATVPVVLAGGWGGVWLHEAVGHLLEADLAAPGAEGASLAGRLGAPVAPPGVTLVDDATVPGGRATAAFDDEGHPAGRTVLIERGVLTALLTDRRCALRLSLPRTGNGRRQDYRFAPLPRMTNLLLMPGEADPADLIASVREGLYVQTVGSGRLEPDTQHWTFEVLEGRRIEQGRLTAPVAGFRIAGIGPETLLRIAGIGRDFQVDAARGLCGKAGQVVPVSVGMPTLLLSACEVREA